MARVAFEMADKRGAFFVHLRTNVSAGVGHYGCRVNGATRAAD